MAHDGKNEHKRNRGKARLAIPSRSNYSQDVIPPNDSSNHASTPRHSTTRPGTVRNPRHHKDKSPRRSPRATEIASIRAYFLIYGSAIKTLRKLPQISNLQIPNRRFSGHLPFTPRTTASLHHFSFHGIIGLLCSQ
jgi:hypothetical protein